MCIVANKGYFYTPHFVQKVEGHSADDSVLDKFVVKHEVLTHISDADYETVISGMQDVTEVGTARIARIDGINMCAKTGTAENYLFLEGKRTKLNNNSMFVCFAPRENPQIAVAVVIQNAGFGAVWAGRIGSLLVEKYLRDTLTVPRVKLATEIANTNLMPGYFVRLQFITDSIRASLWATQTGDSTRWKKFKDPLLRRELLDTMHRATAHITIPFGPRPQIKSVISDTSKRKPVDSATYGKTDTSAKPKRIIIRKATDTAALKPKDKPVVQKDSSTNQSP
jgi:membrane peptidoglycan carboxypeptidase